MFCARRRVKWPGHAAVLICVIHICQGDVHPPATLDGVYVPFITSYLFHAGGNGNPNSLLSNDDLAFQGSVIRGMGFTFDDGTSNSAASSIELMNSLLTANPKSKERIFPYIGGQDVNEIPTHAPDRYVINFGEMTESEARKYPELFGLVRERVLPERKASTAASSKGRIIDEFWQFGHTAKSLYDSIESHKFVIARSLTSKHFAFAILENGFVYDQTLIVFAFDDFGHWSALSSRIHEEWSNFLVEHWRIGPGTTSLGALERFLSR